MPYKNIICGIYCITNKINKKEYIGSSCNILHRWSLHKGHLRKNKHHDFILQRAWNKYGEQNFVFEILEECDRGNLLEIEQNYISVLKPSYNLSKNATRAGAIMSEETKNKFKKTMSERYNFKKGRKCLPEEMERFMRLCHGENHPHAKLNWDIVNEIRKTYKETKITQKALGERFGVRQDNICRILKNEIWRVA